MEVMKTSDSIVNLAKALCHVQAEISFAAKDSNNPFFKSKYADLASVKSVIKEPMAKHGLAISQFPVGTDPGVCELVTILMWSDGETCEYISSSYRMEPKDKTPQGIGSCITYMRRYAISAIIGVIADDDDGQQASTPPPPQKTKPQAQPVDHTKSLQKMLDAFRTKNIFEHHLSAYCKGVPFFDFGDEEISQCRKLFDAITKGTVKPEDVGAESLQRSAVDNLLADQHS